jgi:hypothetical protein
MTFLAQSRMNENTFEHFFQALLILIITALKFTSTKTVGGLASLIADDNTLLLVFSAIWSVKSITMGYIQSVSMSKGDFLPFKGKLFLLLFVLISCLARMFGILVFFVPSLGLVNVLMHWKSGQLVTSALHSNYIFDIDSNGTITTFFELWSVFEKQLED